MSPPTVPWTWYSHSLFCRCGSQSSETWSNLPKIAQLVSGSPKSISQVQKHFFFRETRNFKVEGNCIIHLVQWFPNTEWLYWTLRELVNMQGVGRQTDLLLKRKCHLPLFPSSKGSSRININGRQWLPCRYSLLLRGRTNPWGESQSKSFDSVQEVFWNFCQCLCSSKTFCLTQSLVHFEISKGWLRFSAFDAGCVGQTASWRKWTGLGGN